MEHEKKNELSCYLNIYIYGVVFFPPTVVVVCCSNLYESRTLLFFFSVGICRNREERETEKGTRKTKAAKLKKKEKTRWCAEKERVRGEKRVRKRNQTKHNREEKREKKRVGLGVKEKKETTRKSKEARRATKGGGSERGNNKPFLTKSSAFSSKNRGGKGLMNIDEN